MNKVIYNRTVFSQLKVLHKFSVRYLSKKTLDLSGVYPPIITTFDSSGNISFDKLQQNVALWKSVPFRGMVVLGTNGETAYLTSEEKISLVKYIKESASVEKLVISGSGLESTEATIDLTNKMAEVGSDAALVVNPFYNKGRMTEDVLYDHYIKVADESNIPIIVYNVPGITSIDMSTTLLIKLADHPNIIGMKETGGDITKIGYIVHKTKDKDFQIIAGSAGFLYPAICVGCVAAVMALANILGEEIYQLYNYAISGKNAQAKDLQHRLIGPNLAVTKWYGIPGVKAAMDLKGYIGGPCRLPLKPLSSTELDTLKNEFKVNGFL